MCRRRLYGQGLATGVFRMVTFSCRKADEPLYENTLKKEAR